MRSSDGLTPDWVVDARVGALMTTRAGGVSAAPFDSLNLGRATGDDPAAVDENRRRFESAIGVPTRYLKQVHGAAVVRLAHDRSGPYEADAAITTEPGLACTVLVADCMPVLFAAPGARGVAAAHAGWRGLAGGVLEASAAALCEAAACAPGELAAWLGPCIGPGRFEVGTDVLEAFGAGAAGRFVARPRDDGSPRWLADLPGLAHDRLALAGVTRVGGGVWCTVEDRARFFSFRRDRVTGRMAAAIWIRG
jgi:hypothetical protein